MSVSFFPSLIYGIMVPGEALLQRLPPEWNCAHHYEGPGKFCPDCGSKAGSHPRTRHPDWLFEERILHDGFPFDVVRSSNYEYFIIGQHLVPPRNLPAGYEDGFAKLPVVFPENIEVTCDRATEALRALSGLAELPPLQRGLWYSVYCS